MVIVRLVRKCGGDLLDVDAIHVEHLFSVELECSASAREASAVCAELAAKLGHLYGGVRSGRMARYAVDAPTLLHIVDQDLAIHPSHQLVAPSSIRTEALELLLRDVRDGKRSGREAMACREDDPAQDAPAGRQGLALHRLATCTRARMGFPSRG